MGGKGAFWRETQLRWALYSGRRNTFPPEMRFFKFTFSIEFEHISATLLQAETVQKTPLACTEAASLRYVGTHPLSEVGILRLALGQ